MHKVNRPRLYLLIAVTLFLQFTAARYLACKGVKPDLAAICVVFAGLYFGSRCGLEAGILTGLFIDLFVLDYFGVNALLYGAAGMMAGALSERFSRESKLSRGLIVALITAALMLAHYALCAVLSPSCGLTAADYLAGAVLPGAVFTAILAMAAFPELLAFFRIREQEDFV